MTRKRRGTAFNNHWYVDIKCSFECALLCSRMQYSLGTSWFRASRLHSLDTFWYHTSVLISYWLSCMVIYKIPFAVFKLFASHLTITKRAINGLLKLYKTMGVQQCLRHIFCEKNWFIFVKLSARNIVDFSWFQLSIGRNIYRHFRMVERFCIRNYCTTYKFLVSASVGEWKMKIWFYQTSW